MTLKDKCCLVLPIIQAVANGKIAQFKYDDGDEFFDVEHATEFFRILSCFTSDDFHVKKLRVKPEPK